MAQPMLTLTAPPVSLFARGQAAGVTGVEYTARRTVGSSADPLERLTELSDLVVVALGRLFGVTVANEDRATAGRFACIDV